MAKKPTKLDPMLEKAMVCMGIDPKAHVVKRRRNEELLAYRCRQYGIEAPTFAVIGDAVIVKRLPPIQISASGIVIPEDAQSPHVKGIVLAMGPRAQDELAPIGLGHIVIFGRFAGQEGRDMAPSHYKQGEILLLRARDVIGSDDLKAEMDAGTMRIVQDADGRSKFARVTKVKQLTAKERQAEKLERLANGTNNPHEAEAARKVAEAMK